MIIKKILIFSVLAFLGLIFFVIFFWEIPAPQEKIEKNIEIHRFKNNNKRYFLLIKAWEKSK